MSAVGLSVLFAGVTAACSPVDVDGYEQGLAPRTGPITVVTEPDAMKVLESSGLSFAERFGGLSDEKAKGSKLFERSPRYRDLIDWIRKDVRAAIAQYPKHGMAKPRFGDARSTARERGAGSRTAAFNWQWLRSNSLRWELIGVTNRFDRRVVPGHEATCGEARLIYRAAYSGNRENSRLPITMIVVFPQAKAPDCTAVAESWIRADDPGDKAGAAKRLGKWLAQGPLQGLGKPVSFELNAQTDLWSRFVREIKGVGRHHQYTLRVFRPNGTKLAPVRLENTPNAKKVNGNRSYRAALRTWIKNNVGAINDNAAFLPPLEVGGKNVDLRATQVSSFTAMGITRAVNRPYSQIFGDDIDDFARRLDMGKAKAKALLRRLDMMTCNGCHATRSVVGFHMIGEERDYHVYENFSSYAKRNQNGSLHTHRTDADAKKNEPPFIARLVANKVAVGISPHLRDERDRRTDDLLAYLRSPEYSVPMPPPDQGEYLAGTYGATCKIGKSVPSIYRCDQGLRCVALDGHENYGQCIPKYRANGKAAPGRRSIGDPVEWRDYRVGSALSAADHFKERGPVLTAKDRNCVVGRPTGWDHGFPYGGICTSNTGKLIRHGEKGCTISGGKRIKLGASAYIDRAGNVRKYRPYGGAPRVVCGASPFGNHVANTWGRMSTAAMIWRSVAGGLQISCDENHPCRDEYVCMRTLPNPKSSRPNPRKGTCMPGYVLSQLEIDAHKVPGTSVPQ